MGSKNVNNEKYSHFEKQLKFVSDSIAILAWIRHFVGDPRVRNENCEFLIELLLLYYLELHLAILY